MFKGDLKFAHVVLNCSYSLIIESNYSDFLYAFNQIILENAVNSGNIYFFKPFNIDI